MTAGDDLMVRPVHAGGADKPFGELTVDDVRGHAAELAAAAGWGPTARVATVAHAWRELGAHMAEVGAPTVADLGAESAAGFAERLGSCRPAAASCARRPGAAYARDGRLVAPARPSPGPGGRAWPSAASSPPGARSSDAVERVKLAEELGYDAAYVTHIAARDSLTVLAAYAAGDVAHPPRHRRRADLHAHAGDDGA